MTTVNKVLTTGPDIAEFEALDFDVEAFDHIAHVYVAWQYVRDFDLLEAISRYRDTLRRLTDQLGVPDKYHETLTWFYLIKIAEQATGTARTDWAVFRRRNPSLLQRSPGLVEAYYSADRLASNEARAQFMLPEQIA